MFIAPVDPVSAMPDNIFPIPVFSKLPPVVVMDFISKMLKRMGFYR
jgi:hypothetical protein